MAINAADLDAATLKRLGLTKRDADGGKKPRLSKAGSGGWNLTCVACGYRPTSDRSANTHTADTGHHRYQT